MKLVYDRSGIQLFRGDCREMLPSLAADVLIADPPYGDTSLKWDRRVDGWLEAAQRGAKANGSLWCFGSMRFFLASASLFGGWRYAQELIWEKQNGTNSAGDRFRRVHELVTQFYRADGSWADVWKQPVTTNDARKKQVRRKKRPTHWGTIGEHVYVSEDGGPRLMRSVVKVRNCHGHAVHPTQKPEGIIEPLIRYSCPPDGLVVDPFAGSGTTLLVAKRLGLRAVGIEIDESYCEKAVRRLDDLEAEAA